MNNSYNFIFFGSSHMSLVALEELKRHGIFPSLIITSIDKPKGRKLLLTPPPPKIFAIENNISYLQYKTIKGNALPEVLDAIKNHMTSQATTGKPVTWSLVASYGFIIPSEILHIVPHGTLNIHPSLLPDYRGPTPLQQAILDDNKNTGVSIMVLDEEMDHGDILYQNKLPDTSPWPVSYSLLEKTLVTEGIQMIVKNLKDIELGISIKTPQDHTKATYTKKIVKTDGELTLDNISDTETSRSCYLTYLAYSEWPGTYFFVNTPTHNHMRIKIAKASWDDQAKLMMLETVIPEGQKEISWLEFKKKIISQ